MKQHLSSLMAADQLLLFMEKKSMRGTPCTQATINKALKLGLSCGSQGYNLVKGLAAPLPGVRTLQRHLQDHKFAPGLLHDIIRSVSQGA